MSRLAPEYITISAHITRDTDKAILIEFHGENLWLPRSQIEEINFDFDPPKITMSAWIAKEKEII